MKKILFCFYPLFVKYNHGIALLSALCKERGIDTDLYILDDVHAFLEYLRNNDFDYISFSCVTVHDYEKCLPFLMEVKRLNKTVLLGGVYVRGGGRQIDAHADYICKGEGETLPDFILNGDDRLFNEKMQFGNLNSLPLPDYELFKNIPFERTKIIQGKALPYQSSRGCSHKCSFCEIQIQPKGVRTRYKVKEDLSYLLKTYSPDYFFMGDALLPYNNEMWQDSWEDFRFPFFAYIRADASNESLAWMKDRGMIACAFGIESGDEAYRNEVLKKNLSDKDIYRTVTFLKDNNIQYAPFFMSDTQDETFAMKAKTHSMASKIGGHPYIWEYENIGGKLIWQQQ